MKAEIYDQGDYSVGINPNVMKIELNWDLDSKEDRDEIRETFKKFAVEYLDFCYGRVDVVFDDECGDCLSLLKDNKCINKSCINNLYRDEEEESLLTAVHNKNDKAVDRIEKAAENGKTIRIT